MTTKSSNSCDLDRRFNRSVVVYCRIAVRVLAFFGLTFFKAIEWLLLAMLRRKGQFTQLRAMWLSRSCRLLLPLWDLKVETLGVPPSHGLLVCNHLSYLDMIMIAAQSPTIFVAKHEVRHWPLFGQIAVCAGTIFVNRQRRSDVIQVGKQIEEAISKGVVVCLFAEGTSSSGTQVLPFHSSLLEPIVANRWPVTCAKIKYELADGSVEHEVCYWGRMVFGFHILNLLGKRHIKACLHYSVSFRPKTGRKELAVSLRSQVAKLGLTC